MKETVLKIGRLTESDTLYRADRALYSVQETDCAVVTNPYCVNFFYETLPQLHSAVYAERLQNVVVDFGGATLHLNGNLQPINFFRCENIRLCNVNIEYDRGLFSEASVLEVGADYARVHFPEEFPCRVEDGRLIPYGNYWEDDHLFERQMFFQFFDPVTADGLGLSLGIVGPRIPPKQDRCFNPAHYVVEQDGDDVIFRMANRDETLPDVWKVGSTLVIEHGGRFYPGVILQSCRNVTLENVRLINTNSMGILPLHCENVCMRRLHLMRDERSHGIVSNSADAVHGIANSGDFLIEDSVFENMLDDALNIHGQFLVVTACVGNRLTARITSHSITQYCNLVDVGDELAIHAETTMVTRSTHRVTAVRLVDPYTAEITLDGVPNHVCVNDLVENLSGNCRLTLRRCRFAKANSHLRFQTRGRVLVEDCVTELPFLLTGDANFWFESSPCCDFTVRNTYFAKERAILDSCPEFTPCAAEPYYHKHITVENCLFIHETPLKARCTDDIQFHANRQVFGRPMTLETVKCGAVDAPGCAVHRKDG